MTGAGGVCCVPAAHVVSTREASGGTLVVSACFRHRCGAAWSPGHGFLFYDNTPLSRGCGGGEEPKAAGRAVSGAVGARYGGGGWWAARVASLV